MDLVFSQKWIADAAAEVSGKTVSELTAGDVGKIKYLSFGETFDNGFFIELSTEEPPRPFVNCDGGDEWLCCLRGGDIPKLVNRFKGGESFQLTNFGLRSEDNEWRNYVFSKDARDLWSTFSKSVKRVDHGALLDDDEFDEWYESVRAEAWRDIKLFSGVEVMRIQGLCIPDLGFINVLPELRVVEFVETEFEKSDGIENLLKLEQVSCWLD